jgi:hypothetical protein
MEAESRELRFSGPFLEMFFDNGIMGLWSTQGDENGSYTLRLECRRKTASHNLQH